MQHRRRPPEHVGGHREDDVREDALERAALGGEALGEACANKAAREAPANEKERHAPVDEAVEGVGSRCRGAKAPTEKSEDPTACSMVMPVAAMRPGTIKKPPPMPKKPERPPAPMPKPMILGAFCGLSRTSAFPASLRGRSMLSQAPDRCAMSGSR